MSASTPRPEVIDVASLTDAVTEDYANFPLTGVNDHVVRVSVMTGDFHWHVHSASDEAFLVMAGELVVDLQDASITLRPGQLLRVPKGTRHRTRANGRTVTLTFERDDTSPTGD